MSDWISVDDRLPITESNMIKANSNYMTVDVICFDGDIVYVDEFRAGNTNDFWSEFDSHTVLKWMPLPPPPEQGNV
jgi:hypothetical protein